MKPFKQIIRHGFVALVLLAAAETCRGQGVVIFANYSNTLVSTNAAGLGGMAGTTSSNLNGFVYGLFLAPPTVTSATPLDLLTSAWTFTGVYATNTVIASGGRLSANRGLNSVLVPGWGLVTNSFVVAGWSANVAWEDWAAVAAQLAGASFRNGVWNGPNWRSSSDHGFFGMSIVGSGCPPTPNMGVAPFGLFGTVPNAQGSPIPGFDLFVINVPEPSASALLLVAGSAVALAMRRGRR